MAIHISEAISGWKEASLLLYKLHHDYEFYFDNCSLQFGYLIDGAECERLECASFPIFEGKRIDLNGIPQYVREYDRGNDVELWQIKLQKGTSQSGDSCG